MNADRFGGRKSRMLRQDHDETACSPNSKGYCSCPLTEAPIDQADVICSDLPNTRPGSEFDLHMPVIDLDLPCRLIPSGTAGHFHLYIDTPIPFALYLKILDAMTEAGVVQWGFADTTRERGYGSVRHPDRPKRPGQ